MININFHPRDLKAKTPQRIWAVFYIEKNRIKIDTNHHILPQDWSKKQQKSLTTYDDAAKINNLLKKQKEIIEEFGEKILIKLKGDKKRFYKDVFQTELQDEFNMYFKIGENKPKKEGDVVDFISFIDKYIGSRKDLAEGTLKVMRGTRKHILFAFKLIPSKMLKQYKAMNKAEKIKNPDFLQPDKQIEFDQINYNWMIEFNKYLLDATFTEKKQGDETVLPYSKNYIAKQIKTVKEFASAAVKSGYLHNLSFQGLQCSWEEADNIHLNMNEIKMLKALELDPNSTQGKIRNLFVFNCYLGLRYSDLYKLDENRFTTMNNQLYLKIRMKKVDEIVRFPILESAEKIMKIYNYKLPQVCEPIYNEGIKKVCLKAGLTSLETKRETRGGTKLILTIPKYEMVSSHTARRSFATNFYENGVPIVELMAITGHTSEKAFKNYVKIKAETKFTGFLAIGANM